MRRYSTETVVLKRGRDAVVKINGSVLGGVRRIFCKRKNKIIDINVFLTDKPEHRIIEQSYVMVLKTDFIDDKTFFQDTGIENVEILYGDTAEKYSGCVVERFEETITPAGKIEYEIKIIAEEREVL